MRVFNAAVPTARDLRLMELSALESIHQAPRKTRPNKEGPHATPTFDQPGSLRDCRDANFICIRNANCTPDCARRQRGHRPRKRRSWTWSRAYGTWRSWPSLRMGQRPWSSLWMVPGTAPPTPLAPIEAALVTGRLLTATGCKPLLHPETAD